MNEIEDISILPSIPTVDYKTNFNAKIFASNIGIHNSPKVSPNKFDNDSMNCDSLVVDINEGRKQREKFWPIKSQNQKGNRMTIQNSASICYDGEDDSEGRNNNSGNSCNEIKEDTELEYMNSGLDEIQKGKERRMKFRPKPKLKEVQYKGINNHSPSSSKTDFDLELEDADDMEDSSSSTNCFLEPNEKEINNVSSNKIENKNENENINLEQIDNSSSLQNKEKLEKDKRMKFRPKSKNKNKQSMKCSNSQKQQERIICIVELEGDELIHREIEKDTLQVEGIRGQNSIEFEEMNNELLVGNSNYQEMDSTIIQSHYRSNDPSHHHNHHHHHHHKHHHQRGNKNESTSRSVSPLPDHPKLSPVPPILLSRDKTLSSSPTSFQSISSTPSSCTSSSISSTILPDVISTISSSQVLLKSPPSIDPLLPSSSTSLSTPRSLLFPSKKNDYLFFNDNHVPNFTTQEQLEVIDGGDDDLCTFHFESLPIAMHSPSSQQRQTDPLLPLL